MNDKIFSVEQVKALCGGFPEAKGFAWEEVKNFQLEDGLLQPYNGDTILPGPGLEISLKEHIPSWEIEHAPFNLS